MAELIEHTGVVERIEADRVFVRIAAHGACGSCRAREACGMGEAQEKIIEVPASDAAGYAAGDEVAVGVRRGIGGRAVLLAYVGALVVLVGLLALTLLVLGWNEGLGALVSLCGVGLYYFVLWLFRRRIENTIHFTITRR